MKAYIFSALFIVSSLASTGQITGNLVNSTQLYIQKIDWAQQGWDGESANIGYNLKYNQTNQNWDFVGNQTWRSFNALLFKSSNFYFLAAQTWDITESFPDEMTTEQLIENHSKMTLLAHNGRLGIGTTTPGALLHVNGEIWSNEGLKLFKSDDNRDARFSIDGNGYVHMEYGGGGVGAYLDLKIDKNNDYDARLLVNDDYFQLNGKPILIQTTDYSTESEGYSLSVMGRIRAHEIKIYTGWADYVFDDEYKLLSLEETEEFINENNHLPGVPSAIEIEENKGVELGEMQKIQMEKIEELTLYLINLNKEIILLKEENNKLYNKLNK